MDAEYKVKVSSQCTGHVGLTVPNRNFVRNWSKKGQTIPIPFEVLEEAIFDEGFMNMINQGILHIDDLAAAQALGLEPEDTKVPVNHKVYSDGDLKYMLNFDKQADFEEKFLAMPREQQMQLVDMAVDMRVRDGEKIAFIKKVLGVDIDKEISFDIRMKEE